jgi:radical SAM superfamily enzyme YgiQ (UPF0313 family)
MKISLIYPRMNYEIFAEYYYLPKLMSFGNSKFRCSPLLMMPGALPTLAALTPPGFDIQLVDENVEEVDFDSPVDIVGLSVISVAAERAYRIADKFRARGVYVVLGGVHPTFAADEAAQHADTVIVGEAEATWPQFLHDYRQGRAQPLYRCESKPDLQNTVIPRWDLIKHQNYLSHSIQTTRGCAFDCSFCTVKAMLGRPRFKPVENVIREIEALRKQFWRPWPMYISFADDNIVASPARAKRLFRALIPQKIRWWSQASVTIAQDDELLDLAQQSGCDALLIGFESISQGALAEANKGKVNQADRFRRVIDKLQSRGITLYPSFVFGFDDDDPSVFERTCDFLQAAGVEYPLFSILAPAVGTRLMDRLRDEGRLLDFAWEDLTCYEVCFQPSQMTVQQLYDGFRESIFRMYTEEAIFDRLETAYAKGGTQTPQGHRFMRTLVTGMLLRELTTADKEERHFIRRGLTALWTKRRLKPEVILFQLDRFLFARKFRAAYLRDRSLPAEQPSYPRLRAS